MNDMDFGNPLNFHATEDLSFESKKKKKQYGVQKCSVATPWQWKIWHFVVESMHSTLDKLLQYHFEDNN